MRMSYSAITDPCLSLEVVTTVDRVISFYKKQQKQVPLCSEWREGMYYFEKIGKSLMSKFPQDQDEQLWRYLQAQLLEGLPPPQTWGERRPGPASPPTPASTHMSPPPAHPAPAPGQVAQQQHGRKNSGEEEEIDDDEEEHLKDEQEEIDDDEEQALATRSSSAEHGLITISQYRCGGQHQRL